MEIQITDDARKILQKKGGTMSIDFIRPTGWGKVAEVSVDTNVKNKNLAPYRRLRHGDLRILITPQLIGMAESMQITTKGTLSKSLTVSFRAAPGASAGDDDACCT